MIPSRIEPPAAPPVRSAPSRAPAKDRDAPAFDDVLRDQEAPAVTGQDALRTEADDEGASEEAAGADAPPPPALVSLIAQALALQPGRARNDHSRAPASPSPSDRSGLRWDASGLQACGDPPQGDGKALASLADPAPETFQARRDASAMPDALHGGGASLTPEKSGLLQVDAPRGRMREPDESPTPESRSVVIRNVTSATHLAPPTDPVRQIVSEVRHAIETPETSARLDEPPQKVKLVSLQLEPESLGAVTLRMRLSGAHLSVRVDVAEPATLEMLQRERDRLQKSMATDGVAIESLDIRPAREAPTPRGDNADAPRQDMNAPDQQMRDQRGSAQGNARARDHRDSPQREAPHQNRQDHDSSRNGDSRGLYL